MTTQDGPQKHKGYRRIIPSMTALLQFESVARLNSFTVAAKELGVTQAAVSKQIKGLEENIGTLLFQRGHRNIRLTGSGELLFAIISDALQRVASAFDQITQGVGRQELVLGSTAPFSQLRIMPRINKLNELLPHIQLRLATHMFIGDLRAREFDLAIRFGDGHWDDGTSILLFEEEVFPVCSPAWLARNQAPVTLEELAVAGLLDAASTSEGWYTWPSWFKSLGFVPPALRVNLRCSLYTDSINAALQGYGISLGWGRLVEHLLDSGELVRLEPFVVRPSEAYHVIVPHGRSIDAQTWSIVQWLQGKAQEVE
ncbi:LysR substrate-binding domain-containing protein [Pseudomonas putida]|uniref:LysR substrate-binding domain-containing protein n=1 Tax=Pseudomonas putida TaxID=303 RepID=UPI0008191436|nr:LysR substrate-binding domain-containing protein [Pseudomonas putida]OCT29452.1 LysR family transcriptional regulator [Pseudomonas putida]OCT31148.1 LysR family transcriptional regulator [Pseudomonas putida]OCT33390.1 LysR family transcriptional regulator [Pseudomonas putida]OCT39836.1 LysR family transcriptional regulator [Pseudomonas putida]